MSRLRERFGEILCCAAAASCPAVVTPPVVTNCSRSRDPAVVTNRTLARNPGRGGFDFRVQPKRKAMSTDQRLIVAAAIATLGLASPASAQSFNRTEGTGNELPSYYDSQGGLHASIASIQQNQNATRRSGLNAFAHKNSGLTAYARVPAPDYYNTVPSSLGPADRFSEASQR
jgi:hypothetical protein